ncbi:MAG TPA: tetratricopeptide repeat protein [Albitalea sp.]|nr:tetratricopeptide repeat protein [Albitalea sp.]HJW11735.1 tetratricopeptide repeat protein [Albitalea sp.]
MLASPARADDGTEINRLFRSGQSAEAFARLEQLISARPKDAPLRFLKAVLLADSGRSAEAQAVYQQLTVDFPELPEPYNNLAVLYAAQGDYVRARAALETALRASPGYAVAHQNLADVYVQLARQSYAEALRLDPSNNTITPKLSLLRQLTPTSLPTPAPGTRP